MMEKKKEAKRDLYLIVPSINIISVFVRKLVEFQWKFGRDGAEDETRSGHAGRVEDNKGWVW